jgi:hypothetical protein
MDWATNADAQHAFQEAARQCTHDPWGWKSSCFVVKITDENNTPGHLVYNPILHPAGMRALQNELRKEGLLPIRCGSFLPHHLLPLLFLTENISFPTVWWSFLLQDTTLL